MTIKLKNGDLGVGKSLDVARNVSWLRKLTAFLRRSSKVIILGSLVIIIMIFWPVIGEEIKYYVGQTPLGKGWVKLGNTEVSFVSEQVPGKTIVKEKPKWKVPDENYSVYIPKILAKSRVIPNVDPGDKSEYQWALKLGVAEAAGLSHPGQLGTTYLFAHSVGTRLDFARYNAVFYLLHKLEIGDEVEIVYAGNLYKYQVDRKEVVNAADLKYFEPQKEQEKLVLQTCYPPGTAWKRLIIVAKRT
jgi:LPXTG-site transpeptidase (sortase) family protein